MIWRIHFTLNNVIWLTSAKPLRQSIKSFLRYWPFLNLSACLTTPTKKVASTHRKLWGLSACKKSISSHTLFIRYYTLKNPTIWLADRTLTHNSRTRIFPNTRFRLILEKSDDKDISRTAKNTILLPFLTFFIQNWTNENILTKLGPVRF